MEWGNLSLLWCAFILLAVVVLKIRGLWLPKKLVALLEFKKSQVTKIT